MADCFLCSSCPFLLWRPLLRISPPASSSPRLPRCASSFSPPTSLRPPSPYPESSSSSTRAITRRRLTSPRATRVRSLPSSPWPNDRSLFPPPCPGVESLALTRISQSAARQRQGRAGREGPGFCFRLFTAREFKTFADAPQPEILRSNLAQTVLQLKEMGIEDIATFPLLDRPSPELSGSIDPFSLTTGADCPSFPFSQLLSPS